MPSTAAAKSAAAHIVVARSPRSRSVIYAGPPVRAIVRDARRCLERAVEPIRSLLLLCGGGSSCSVSAGDASFAKGGGGNGTGVDALAARRLLEAIGSALSAAATEGTARHSLQNENEEAEGRQVLNVIALVAGYARGVAARRAAAERSASHAAYIEATCNEPFNVLRPPQRLRHYKSPRSSPRPHSLGLASAASTSTAGAFGVPSPPLRVSRLAKPPLSSAVGPAKRGDDSTSPAPPPESAAVGGGNGAVASTHSPRTPSRPPTASADGMTSLGSGRRRPSAPPIVARLISPTAYANANRAAHGVGLAAVNRRSNNSSPRNCIPATSVPIAEWPSEGRLAAGGLVGLTVVRAGGSGAAAAGGNFSSNNNSPRRSVHGSRGCANMSSSALHSSTLSLAPASTVPCGAADGAPCGAACSNAPAKARGVSAHHLYRLATSPRAARAGGDGGTSPSYVVIRNSAGHAIVPPAVAALRQPASYSRCIEGMGVAVASEVGVEEGVKDHPVGRGGGVHSRPSSAAVVVCTPRELVLPSSVLPPTPRRASQCEGIGGGRRPASAPRPWSARHRTFATRDTNFSSYLDQRLTNGTATTEAEVEEGAADRTAFNNTCSGERGLVAQPPLRALTDVVAASHEQYPRHYPHSSLPPPPCGALPSSYAFSSSRRAKAVASSAAPSPSSSLPRHRYYRPRVGAVRTVAEGATPPPSPHRHQNAAHRASPTPNRNPSSSPPPLSDVDQSVLVDASVTSSHDVRNDVASSNVDGTPPPQGAGAAVVRGLLLGMVMGDGDDEEEDLYDGDA